MARIAAEELERLRREVDLAGLVRGSGVELAAQGQDLVGRCPLGTHEDTTPSFRVTPSKGLFHCFGCGESGDAVAWVQRTRGVSFRNAVEVLRSGDELPPVVTDAMNDGELLAAVAGYYAQRLAVDDAGKAYC